MTKRRSLQPASRRRAPTLPVRSPDGVDVTLIRWMLSMTPRERLRTLEGAARSLARLRGQGEVKQETAGVKDKAVLALLRHTLAERRRSDS